MNQMDDQTIGVPQVYDDHLWIEPMDHVFSYFRKFAIVHYRKRAQAQPKFDGSVPCRIHIGLLHHKTMRIQWWETKMGALQKSRGKIYHEGELYNMC